MPEDCKETNVIPVFEKGNEEGPKELPASQPHFNPCKGDGVPHSRGYLFHPHGRLKCDQE